MDEWCEVQIGNAIISNLWGTILRRVYLIWELVVSLYGTIVYEITGKLTCKIAVVFLKLICNQRNFEFLQRTPVRVVGCYLAAAWKFPFEQGHCKNRTTDLFLQCRKFIKYIRTPARKGGKRSKQRVSENINYYK